MKLLIVILCVLMASGNGLSGAGSKPAKGKTSEWKNVAAVKAALESRLNMMKSPAEAESQVLTAQINTTISWIDTPSKCSRTALQKIQAVITQERLNGSRKLSWQILQKALLYLESHWFAHEMLQDFAVNCAVLLQAALQSE